jgi:hypothetical protein
MTMTMTTMMTTMQKPVTAKLQSSKAAPFPTPRWRSRLAWTAGVLLASACAVRLFVPVVGDAVAIRLRDMVPRVHAGTPLPGARVASTAFTPAGTADLAQDNRVLTPGAQLPGVFGVRDGGSDARPAPRAVFVSKATVLQFARRGRPRGVPVAGGLQLHGVNGTGLRDGDVLISMQGAPISSQDEVTAIVFAAVGAGAKTISGVAKRGAETIAITVEVPSAPPAAK